LSEVRVVPVPVRMGPMNVMAYLLIGERVVVVDTGVSGQADRILARLAQEGRAACDVSLILLTHGHRDHAGSAAALQKATGAPVALGAGDEQKYLVGRDDEMHARGAIGSVLMRFIRRRKRPEHAAVPAPDLIVASETSLAAYGVDAVVVPTPGHSRGSLSVFTADGDALVGDLLGGGGRSRPEPRPGVFVSDEDAMDASIQAVLARNPRRVFTGHDAEPFTLDQLTSAFGAGS
jgi:glyoxylase-like metal-dependent hydrolase (beta-lactamase superfamily II)